MKNLNKSKESVPRKKVAKSCSNCNKRRKCKEVGELCNRYGSAINIMIT